jgi:protein TonB
MSPRVSLCALLIVACSQPRSASDTTVAGQPVPDERPIMVNRDMPFHYPGALYARRSQGNVTLRLFVDSTGQTVPDSTRLEEPSGFAAFDSAAIAGARELRFIPAKLHGEPMGMTILFPVYFRHPEAQPLPGDSTLKKGGQG